MTPAKNGRRLWGIGTPRTLRPHWMLAELGLEYETVEIITRTEGMASPEFRALSERGKIPLYEDGDLMIGESAAIVLFLADHYRGKRIGKDLSDLAPATGTLDDARHRELCFFIMTEMDSALYVIRRHGGLAEIYGESPVAIQSAKDYFLRSSLEIEHRLSDGRPYLLGEHFSAADLLLKTCLDWSGFVQIALPESLTNYSNRLGQRTAFTTAMGINFTPASVAALKSPSP